MESLNASLLNVVLKIREGSGFGFLTCPFVIACNLNGNVITADPVPFSANPTFETDFVWEAEKKFLRSMRSNNYSIRLECFSDSKYKKHDKIGYILLNMKQAQIVSPKLGSNIKYTWHKLLGVRNEAKSQKPEINLSLFIKEADFEIGSKTPKTPPIAASVSDKQQEVPNKEMNQDAIVPSEGYISNSTVQVGSPRETDLQFKLQIKITNAVNLSVLLPEPTDSQENKNLNLEFAMFGESYKTGNLSSCDGRVEGECFSIHIRSQLQSLTAYFTEFPILYFLVQTSGQTISKAPFDMHGFLSREKCEQLIHDKMSVLSHECELRPENQVPGSSCFFIVRLELEKGKVNNPVKPFTISSIKQSDITSNVDKGGKMASGNKNQIRAVSCTNKINSIIQSDQDCGPVEKTSGESPLILNSESQPIFKMQNNYEHHNNQIKENYLHSTDTFSQVNDHQVKDYFQSMENQPALKNFNNFQNMNPAPQNTAQFIYPYFQLPHSYGQDGRGDALLTVSQQESTGLAESVKAKVTEELSKKTYEELEAWKEKQKENYKNELKKKLDKEVKRLTTEWLCRQSELEREATSNIEESVSLSQQLHSTSAELQIRLEAVNRQQLELEREREGLEKKYSEKHLEIREASKKSQANLQQQITSLTTELGELKAKVCSLTKENEMLRNGLQSGGDNDGKSVAVINKPASKKSAHLTDQQMTSLLVDMKSLEEKLRAALESKEFFRKEWSSALREIHRMKTEQEQQVRLQLQTQRQELDNLRLVGLITADEKASKNDLASLRDLRNQIVRLNTPKTS